MRQSFASREHWLDVSPAEVDTFLREYPRALEPRPPLSRKANYREWLDATLGSWPDNAVAKAWTRERCSGYQIRRAPASAFG